MGEQHSNIKAGIDSREASQAGGLFLWHEAVLRSSIHIWILREDLCDDAQTARVDSGSRAFFVIRLKTEIGTGERG